MLEVGGGAASWGQAFFAVAGGGILSAAGSSRLSAEPVQGRC